MIWRVRRSILGKQLLCSRLGLCKALVVFVQRSHFVHPRLFFNARVYLGQTLFFWVGGGGFGVPADKYLPL